LDLVHIGTSLSEIRSFSHVQCDAILQSRNIEILGAFDPGKSSFKDGVYFGFFWMIGFLVLCSGMLVESWRSQDSKAKQGRRILPFLLLFGFVLLFSQLQSMARYVDVCRGILQLSPAAPPYPETAEPWLTLFALTAFAGVWYTVLVAKYREATSLGERALPTVMMVFGLVFFAFVGGAVILSR